MARQLPKVYIRIDPNIDAHPDPEAMLQMMVWANRQPHRGRFRELDVLRRVLGAKRLAAAVARGDLRQEADGGVFYLAGWDEWQEGDQTVGDRVASIRERRKSEREQRAKPPFNTGAELATASRYQSVTEPLPDRSTPSDALGVRRCSPVATLPENWPAGRPPFVADPERDPDRDEPADPPAAPSDASPPAAGEAVADLCAECEALLDRGAEAALALGSAWQPDRELAAASRTARNQRTLSRHDLTLRRKSQPWWLATRDRLRDRVAALAAAVPERAEPEPEPEVQDREAAALWDRVLERLRADVQPRAWATWLEPTAGCSVTDRLVVAVPGPAWPAWCQAYTAAALVAAAAEGKPVVAVDWLAAPLALDAATTDAALWVRQRWPALRAALDAWLREHRAPDEPLISALWRWADEPSDGPLPPIGVPRSILARLETAARAKGLEVPA